MIYPGWTTEVGRNGWGGGARERDEDGVPVEVALAGSADDGGEGVLGAGSPPGAIPAADLARNDGGADVLFGAPVGRADGRVAQEGEQGGPFSGEMRGEPYRTLIGLLVVTVMRVGEAIALDRTILTPSRPSRPPSGVSLKQLDSYGYRQNKLVKS